jgi:pimeloyl-ACP methyl ester carboxylesterase
MSEIGLPETRYALSGDVNIAYQVMGAGPVDIIMVPGVVSHIEFLHEFVGYTAFLRRLSAFARVVTFDKRGQGLSDRISDAPSWSSAWMTFVPSWRLLVRSTLQSLGFPRDAR